MSKREMKIWIDGKEGRLFTEPEIVSGILLEVPKNEEITKKINEKMWDFLVSLSLFAERKSFFFYKFDLKTILEVIDLLRMNGFAICERSDDY